MTSTIPLSRGPVVTTRATVVGVPAATRTRRSSAPAHRRPVIALAAGTALAALAAAVMTDQGLRSSIGTAASAAVSALGSTTVAALLALTGVAVLYQVAAAAAARAAAGVPLPFAELVGVQFVAAAANRFTPVGLGSVAVTGRYFTRRGRLSPAQSAAAVSALTLLGGVADLAAFAILIGIGAAAGLAGAGSELPTLTRRLLAIIPRPAGSWWWIAGAGIGIGIGIAMIAWRRCRAGSRLATAARRYASSIAAMLARPGRLAALLSASAGTTLLLAAGFAAAAVLAPSGVALGDAGALMIGYMVAAAAGNAVPTPGGVGGVDAALVAVLLASGIPLANAVITVLVFRLITFWAPAVIGACLVPRMHRRGAL